MNAARLFLPIALIALLAAASPAAAQWTRINALPITNVFGLIAKGDTIVAGVDTVAWVSTNAGASWKASVRPDTGVVVLDAPLMRNGRLYVGSYGRGAFVSDDRGDTWQPYNQGLVGGFLNTQLFLNDLVVRGDSVYAATAGDGVWVRRLSGGNWSRFGAIFEENQAANTSTIALGGTRLIVSTGANGTVFFRDPGDAEWTLSWLDNVGLEPGISAFSSIATGTGWIVGTNVGVFNSAQGEEPWSFQGLGSVDNASFARRGGVVFAAFTKATQTLFEYTGDDGATWHLMESVPAAFVFRLAVVGNDLYAAQGNGLWRRSIANVDVSQPPTVGAGLQLALAGPQPAAGDVRFRFTLAQPGEATLDLFDVAGRHVERMSDTWSAGPHELAWNAGGRPSGVYVARLTALGRREAVRVMLAR